jgi:formylmethanofuran dehydrogenase subunit B
VAGIDKSDFERLSANLIGSENVSIFVGQGLLRTQKKEHPLRELIKLVDIVNSEGDKGRASLLFPGGHYNMIGFDHTALSYTGKNHSLQYKNHSLVPTDDNIVTKIKKDDFDLSIIVGTDPISHLPVQLSKKLASKPIILLDNRKSSTYFIADVILPTAITGVEAGGTAIRLDNVPIHVEKVVNAPNEIPSDEKLLKQINEKLQITMEGN